MENTVKYEVWVMLERPRRGPVIAFSSSVMSKADVIAKDYGMDGQGGKIEVIPA